MRKKIYLIITLLALTTITSCGKASKDTQLGNSQSIETNSNSDNNDSNGNSENTNTENTEALTNEDAIALYEGFMRGEVPVYMNIYIDNCQKNGQENSTQYFQKDTPYDFDAVAQGVANILGYEDAGDFALTEAEYAYIDCQGDGKKELAIQFPGVYCGYGDMNDFIIIMEIDGKLQMVFEESSGYRSFSKITPHGIIISGGSAGASQWYQSYKTLDVLGQTQFIYSETDLYYIAGIYLPWIDNISELMDKYEVQDMYTEQYCFEEYSGNYDDYDDYVRKSKITYYQEMTADEPVMNPDIYKSDSNFSKFWNETGMTTYTPDEMKKLLDERVKEIVKDSAWMEEDEVEWKNFKTLNIVKGNPESCDYEEDSAPYYYISNPGWDYYSTVDDTNTYKVPKLVKLSEKTNQITDDEAWLNSINETAYDPSYKSDEYFTYSLSGDNDYEPYIIEIYQNGVLTATLNFNEFRYGTDIKEGDRDYVLEGIRGVQYYNGLLYVSMSHRTYAESCPQNAYVMALDPNNDYQVVWKSEPLRANAYNFAIYDDTLITGYGFTNEPDYIYLLNIYNGTTVGQYPVKTGPDYFFVKGNILFVRSYDTNYEYQLMYE